LRLGKICVEASQIFPAPLLLGSLRASGASIKLILGYAYNLEATYERGIYIREKLENILCAPCFYFNP
jgi:hypothetical protein